MQWNAVPVLVLAGIAGYAGVLFAGLYVALRRLADERARREYLSFALTCFAVVGYDTACAVLYDARTVQQGYLWTRISLSVCPLGAIAYSMFICDFLREPMPTLLRWGNWALGALGLTLVFWESEYTLTSAAPSIRHLEVFGRPIVYYEPTYGVLSQLLLLGFFLVFVFLAARSLRYFRSGDGRTQKGKLGFLCATAVTVVCMTNDGLSAAGVINSMYSFEYGFTALIMAMGYVLLMRFGALHETVNALNADLTRSNSDLALALDQAREGARVKTEFLASISHELRTPLNAIINIPEGLLEELVPARTTSCGACGSEFELEEGEQLSASTECAHCHATGLTAQTRELFRGDPGSMRASLDTVVRAARHLLGLVNDLLDSSKLELGRAVIVPADFRLGELVAEVVSSAQTLAHKAGVHVRFTADALDAPDTITADRVRIGQVLYNLIGNAIKFSPAGGEIDVSMLAVSTQAWELRVRDRGIGIAQEHHEIIFEKFRQVDGGATRSYGGTGLGLAISKGLVELHGGRIWVESVEGQGSTFVVWLPRTPPVAAVDRALKPAA